MWRLMDENDPMFRACPQCDGRIERFTLTDESGVETHIAERCKGHASSNGIIFMSCNWREVYIPEYAHLAV